MQDQFSETSRCSSLIPTAAMRRITPRKSTQYLAIRLPLAISFSFMLTIAVFFAPAQAAGTWLSGHTFSIGLHGGDGATGLFYNRRDDRRTRALSGQTPSSLGHESTALMANWRFQKDSRWSYGLDYMRRSGFTDGTIRARQRLLFFDFFIPAPVRVEYKHQVATSWVSANYQPTRDLKLGGYGGIQVTHLRLLATSPDLPSRKLAGWAPLPILGAQISHGNAKQLKTTVSFEYGQLGAGRLQGKTATTKLQFERSLMHNLIIGAGVMTHRFRLDADRPDYEAYIDLRRTGLFTNLAYRFD